MNAQDKPEAILLSTTHISRKTEELWQAAIPSRASNIWGHPYSSPDLKYKLRSSTSWGFRDGWDDSFRGHVKKCGGRHGNPVGASKDMAKSPILLNLSGVSLYPLDQMRIASGSSSWSQLDTYFTKEALILELIRSSFHSTLQYSDQQQLTRLMTNFWNNVPNRRLSQLTPAKSESQIRQTLVSLRDAACIPRSLLRRRLDAGTHERLSNEEQFLEKLLILMRHHQTISTSIYEMLLSTASIIGWLDRNAEAEETKIHGMVGG